MSNALGKLRTTRAFSASDILEGLSRSEGPNGGTLIEGMPVFRAGTFKDSRGIQATWEPEHLEQMVFNFNLLHDRGIFPNVPVRDGHKELFGNGGTVIGYVVKISHDQDSGRLLADFELTDPAAVEKLDNKTFRARSAEVGMYETNDEALYYPVFMGFAFVDIGAVEGLYSKENPQDGFVVLTDSKEHDVSGTQPGKEAVAFTLATGSESDPAKVQAYITSLETKVAGIKPPTVFKVNGVEESDHSKVMAHIAALEGAATEAVEKGRKDFVAALATDAGGNKITQPQVEGLTEVALGLDDAAFEKFRAAYDAAPSHPITGRHAQQPTPGEPTPKGDEPSELDILEEQVAQHRRSGMPEAELVKLSSYTRLQELKGSTKTKE